RRRRAGEFSRLSDARGCDHATGRSRARGSPGAARRRDSRRHPPRSRTARAAALDHADGDRARDRPARVLPPQRREAAVRLVSVCVVVTLLAGCAGERELSTKGPKLSESVAKLPEVNLPEVRVPPPTRADVMAAYKRIYGTVPDPQDNLKVGKRL